jgi:hypothetical protein
LDSTFPTGLKGLNVSQVTALALVNTSGSTLELHVAQRGLGSPPFLVLDTAAGSLLRSYGQLGVTLLSPHGLASTLGVGEPGPSRLWVTDIANGTVLQLLPAGMTKAVWELILLLLLDPQQHSAEITALMDTGLSPKQGLIAYMRLLDQVQRRMESFDDVPEYRKIFETAILPPVVPPPQQDNE